MMQSNEAGSGHGAGCGVRLRLAREAANLAIDDVASRLRMPARVVRALEADDWSQLGAPVFARGQLRSYARLLGVDIEAELDRAPAAAIAPATLVSHSHTPTYQRVFEQVTRRAIYIVMTAAIAVPVWIATRPHVANTVALQSLDLPETPAVGTASPVAAGSEAPVPRTPVAASMASLHPAAATGSTLSLTFSGDSWVQVFAVDGTSIEQGLLAAGQQRSYAAGQVGRVVLGNSAAVQVLHAGRPVDLAPFSRANVARFTLSSDGSLAPPAN